MFAQHSIHFEKHLLSVKHCFLVTLHFEYLLLKKKEKQQT